MKLNSTFSKAAACGTMALALAACAATPTPAPTAIPAATAATTATPVSQATKPAAPPTAAAQPTAAQKPTTAPTTAPVAQPTVAVTASPAAQVIKKFNLNTATDADFLTVPGVGARMVREFFEYRPYTTIGQFRREIGKYVNAAQVAAYEKYVFVPIAPNKADAATLQQLPGVDAAIADKLIAARPFASKDAFLKKLTEFVSAEQAAAGAAYVDAP